MTTADKHCFSVSRCEEGPTSPILWGEPIAIVHEYMNHEDRVLGNVRGRWLVGNSRIDE